MISRVGIGLDNVNLLAARERGIKVSYTPDAPTPAVAELTLCMILTLLRSMHISNINMHRGKWQRTFGRRLSKVTVGIIGVGRIGSQVIKKIGNLGVARILANDISPNYTINSEVEIEWASKSDIYKNADVICLHVPFTEQTQNMIKKNELNSMKNDALIINTSRGGIINEKDLHEVLIQGHLGGAALDVLKQNHTMAYFVQMKGVF